MRATATMKSPDTFIDETAPSHKINYKLSASSIFKTGTIQAIYTEGLRINQIIAYNLFDDKGIFLKGYTRNEAEIKKHRGHFTEYQNLGSRSSPK